MAVVTRHRSGGTVAYYVTFEHDGRKVWEFAGRDKRYAKSLNAQRKREVREGTYHPKLRGAPTVAEYAEQWISNRKVRSAEAEEHYLRSYVLSRAWFAGLKMMEVRKVHIKQLVDELKAATSVNPRTPGKALAPKTIANIYGVVVTMFNEAEADERILVNPCKLKRKTLPRRAKVKRMPYDVASIAALLTSPKVHPMARVFASIALFTGMREGEICGRRWRDLDRSAEPMWCLTVDSQYDDRPLKTDDEEAGEHARKVPIHPKLQAVLEWWWSTGFELVYVRKPTRDDFIVPISGGDGNHTRSSAYKMWRRALEAAGVVNLSLHSTRHTFVTLCRRGGADTAAVETITHNAKGQVIDQYTHRQWDELCEAVRALDVARGGGSVLGSVLPNHTTAKLLVEALGIEPSGRDVTTGKSRSDDVPPEDAEPPKRSRSIAGADAQWDADHQASQSVATASKAWLYEATSHLYALRDRAWLARVTGEGAS